MENVDRAVDTLVKEIYDVEKKMRKLRDKGLSGGDEYVELKGELSALRAAWNILT